jgi:general secretion pathway protein E/type IV pilus assembly protein PilB
LKPRLLRSLDKCSDDVIRLEALKGGMVTLRQDGWRKVLSGTTTVEEVTRTTAGDIS